MLIEFGFQVIYLNSDYSEFRCAFSSFHQMRADHPAYVGQHKQGDPLSFDENWKTRSETHYNHYSSKSPENQIQLAFRSHFEVFSNLLEAYPTNDKKMIDCIKTIQPLL